MLQTKALKLLNKLDPTEFKGFLRFLQSPIFNKNNRVISLYNLLKKYYPTFDSPKLDREKLYAKLYPNKKYSYQQFANLISELTRLVEEYYSHLAFKADTFQQRKLLIQSYRDRDLYELFEKETNELYTYIKRPTFNKVNLEKFLLLKSKYFHPYHNTLDTKSAILEKLMNHLDDYYLEEKLLLAIEIKGKAAFLNTQLEIPLLESIKLLVKEKKQNYSLYLYFLLLEMLNSKTSKNFFVLKNYYEENYDKINKELQQIIFRALTNFCSHQLNTGSQSFFKEFFNLNQFGLNNNLILKGNTISSPSFINIVLVGINANISNKNWVLEFIKDNAIFLDSTIKEEVLPIAYAAIEFAEKKYESVIDNLLNYKSSNPARSFTAKKLKIRAYFEKFLIDSTFYELFLSSCLSFERNLYRNKIKSTPRLESNINFSILIRKIAKKILEKKLTPQSKKKLTEEILEKKYLVLKYWFLSRLEHL